MHNHTIIQRNVSEAYKYLLSSQMTILFCDLWDCDTHSVAVSTYAISLYVESCPKEEEAGKV